MLAAIAVLLVVAGCTEHGQTPPGGGSNEPGETSAFVPLICTGGLPGEPNCPFNVVDLSELGADARLSFLVEVLGSGTFLNEMSIATGVQGIHLERAFVFHETAMKTTVITLETVVDIPPDTTAPLGSGSAAASEAPAQQMAFRADDCGPFLGR